jgi:hypothetical protein
MGELMAEDDIRNYLNGQTPRPGIAPGIKAVRRPPQRRQPQSTFKNLQATHLLCPRCKKATPVREKVLLFLPDGDLYDYVCTICGASCGTKKAGH